MRRMFRSLKIVSAALLCYVTISTQAFTPIAAFTASSSRRGLLVPSDQWFAALVSFPSSSSPSLPALTMVTSSSSSSEDISPSLLSELQRANSHVDDVVTVKIPKPLGIVLEEVSADDSEENCSNGGVRIIEVNPKGNAAKYGRDISRKGGDNAPLLCVRDKILAVNGEDVSTAAFDTVMEKIIASDSPVELSLQRRSPLNGGSVVVITWGNGVSVAAQPGEYLGNVASEAGMKIQYSCRSGSCGTCEQLVDLNGGKEQRYCRPCSFRLPKNGVHSMKAKPSDRLLSF